MDCLKRERDIRIKHKLSGGKTALRCTPALRQSQGRIQEIMGAFFWDYSGIGILGIEGICVLLGAIPFSEWTEYHSVHSAPDSRMNRMEGMRFTRNRQNTRSFERRPYTEKTS